MQTKTERNLNEIFDVDPIPEDAKSDLVQLDDEDVPNYKPTNFNPSRIEDQENEELWMQITNYDDVMLYWRYFTRNERKDWNRFSRCD